MRTTWPRAETCLECLLLSARRRAGKSLSSKRGHGGAEGHRAHSQALPSRRNFISSWKEGPSKGDCWGRLLSQCFSKSIKSRAQFSSVWSTGGTCGEEDRGFASLLEGMRQKTQLNEMSGCVQCYQCVCLSVLCHYDWSQKTIIETERTTFKSLLLCR